MTEKRGSNWCLYAIECSNGSIYIGITNNLSRRLATHSAGKGSKFVRSWRPFRLITAIGCASPTTARQLECRLKKMSRRQKVCELQKLRQCLNKTYKPLLNKPKDNISTRRL